MISDDSNDLFVSSMLDDSDTHVLAVPPNEDEGARSDHCDSILVSYKLGQVTMSGFGAAARMSAPSVTGPTCLPRA